MLKDPGSVLELIAVVQLSVVRGSMDPHCVDAFEPAVSEPAQGISALGKAPATKSACEGDRFR